MNIELKPGYPAAVSLSDELKNMATFYMQRPRVTDRIPRLDEMSDRECKAVTLLLLKAAAAIDTHSEMALARQAAAASQEAE